MPSCWHVWETVRSNVCGLRISAPGVRAALESLQSLANMVSDNTSSSLGNHLKAVLAAFAKPSAEPAES